MFIFFDELTESEIRPAVLSRRKRSRQAAIETKTHQCAKGSPEQKYALLKTQNGKPKANKPEQTRPKHRAGAEEARSQ
jgi:hypothetical protein